MPEFDPYGSIKTSVAALTSEQAAAASGSEDDFALAKRQSLGFFDDIPSSHWKRLQEKVNAMSPNFVEWIVKHRRNERYIWFWQGHYEPDFVCLHERRIGKPADGGKWICDPHRITQKVKEGGECLVYSIGSNNDFSFEESVHKDISPECEIHTFDFTDYSEGAKATGGKIIFHQQGIGMDKKTPRGEFKSVSRTIEELGHQNKVIDIFKIDCEGCEWETAANWFEAEDKHNIVLRQIQVELHGLNQEQTHKFFDLMYEKGYVIFHKEMNLISIPTRNMAIEYAFLKLDKEFVNAVPRKKGAEFWRENQSF